MPIKTRRQSTKEERYTLDDESLLLEETSDTDSLDNFIVGDTDYSSDEDDEYIKRPKQANPVIMNNVFLETIPEPCKELYMNYCTQLSRMEPSNGEYFKLNQWKEAFEKIPFGKYLSFPFETMDHDAKCAFINESREQLDSMIYGHSTAKDEIICILVKWLMNPQFSGQVIGLHGNPGCGKTLLGRTALGAILQRPVHYISLAGMAEGAFLDGFDYTYEGARWGKVVDGVLQSKCMNPILFFDELDKVSESKVGYEIIGKLINLTDKNQNNSFMDRYFHGVPFDLSKTVIIFSFNDITKIDKILLDRIKVIQMQDFSPTDKYELFKGHLLKDIMSENNFKENEVSFSKDTINEMILRCPEPGVRNLKRLLDTVLMKLNVLRFSPNKHIPVSFSKPIVINTELLHKLLSA